MILMAGNVGSGKTEQGKRLARYLNCPWLSTGQLLRERATPEQAAKMNVGELLADGEIFAILELEFKKIGAQSHEFILDGSPRTLAQSQWLVSKIKAGELKFTAAIVLDISKAEIIKRLADRQRSDDTKPVIEDRIEEYRMVTKPALDYLAEQGLKVSEVDGQGTIEQVEGRIHQALGTHVS